MFLFLIVYLVNKFPSIIMHWPLILAIEEFVSRSTQQYQGRVTSSSSLKCQQCIMAALMVNENEKKYITIKSLKIY